MRDRGIRPEGDPHPVGGALDRRRDGVAAAPVVGWREGRASNLGPAAAADLKPIVPIAPIARKLFFIGLLF